MFSPPHRLRGHDDEHAPVRLWQTLVGVVFVLNAFIVDWLFDRGQTIASVSAFPWSNRPWLPNVF
jgi:hypothetical protein